MSAAGVRPIFLLSLPRSGSTLLQRLLASHPEIATSSEPWFLLPLLYTTRPEGAYAEYGHPQMVRAVSDFAHQLRGGRAEYRREVATLARRLYADAAGERRYFLDKTPRYHLIVREILDLFPDGRFIFLWRQPLAVAASMIDSFGRGRWNLDRYQIDLEGGVHSLVDAFGRSGDRAIALRYEEVVADPERETVRLWRWLGIEPGAALPLSIIARPDGRMGDRTGSAAYAGISTEPLERWRVTLGTAYRRHWAARYLERIGRDATGVMGYDFSELQRDVRQLKLSPRSFASDVLRSGNDRTLRWMTQNVTRNSLRRAPDPPATDSWPF